MAAAPEAGAFARIHPVVALADGLFRALPNGGRSEGEPFELARQEYMGREYVFESTSELGADDLRVMQGVFMLASKPSSDVEIDVHAPVTDTGKRLAAVLSFVAEKGEPALAKYVTFSAASLGNAAAYVGNGGGSRRIVGASLERLSGVVVRVFSGPAEVSRSLLLAVTGLDPLDDRGPRENSALALCPDLSVPVVTGLRGHRHCRMEFSEIGALGKSGCARIIHQRLCSFVDPGKTHKVRLRNLMGYAFGTTEVENTLRRRLSDTREAMETLALLPGWSVSHDGVEGGSRVYTITRPGKATKPTA